MTTPAKSTDEAKGLLKSYPNLKAIIAPTTVGVVAAAQVVTDEGLIGKVNVTGLALPSEFKKFIDNGASQAVALWNPIDLGYSAIYLAHDLAVKKDEAKPGATLSDRPSRQGDARRRELRGDGASVPVRQVQHRRVLEDLLIDEDFPTGTAGCKLRRAVCPDLAASDPGPMDHQGSPNRRACAPDLRSAASDAVGRVEELPRCARAAVMSASRSIRAR